MKELILILSLFVVGGQAFGDQLYQMTNAPGVWKAEFGSGAFSYYDLLITTSADGKSLDVEHCTLDIEISGNCTNYDGIVGIGGYSQATANILIVESNGSPTPTYTVTINPVDSKELHRPWGRETIRYFKFQERK